MKNRQQQEIDGILSSLDGMKRAEAPSFLHTRIQAKIDQANEVTSWAWISKPAFSFSAVLLLVMVNVAAYKIYGTRSDDRAATTTGIQQFASEYQLDGNADYQANPD